MSRQAAREFIAAVSQRRGDLICQGSRTDEEARELHALQAAVAAAMALAFPTDDSNLRRLESLVGIESPCPRCGK